MTLFEAFRQRFQNTPKPVIWVLSPFLLVWFMAWCVVQLFRCADLEQLVEKAIDSSFADYKYKIPVMSDQSEVKTATVTLYVANEQAEIPA